MIYGCSRGLGMLAVLAGLAGGSAVAEVVPVDPNASPDVKRVLAFLHTVREKKQTLSAQHVYLSSKPNEPERVKELTGDYPALIEFDLLHFNEHPGKRDKNLAFGVDYYRAGGLVGVSWHETSPALSVLDEGGYPKGTKKRMNQADFDKVLTPGTELHTRWLEHVDLAAGWLGHLQEKGVVVLWRPYHEMTGGWFWWGAKTPESFRKLWIALFERLTKHHGLHNLIWVWSAAQVQKDYEGYCPVDYVDIGGVDMYKDRRNDPDFARKYQGIAKAAQSKPIALTEVGLIPEITLFHDQAPFIWFEIWGRGFLDREHYGAPKGKTGNLAADVQAFYAHPAVLTRSELPFAAPTE